MTADGGMERMRRRLELQRLRVGVQHDVLATGGSLMMKHWSDLEIHDERATPCENVTFQISGSQTPLQHKACKAYNKAVRSSDMK